MSNAPSGPAPENPASPGANRRRHGRLRTHDMTSNFGRVMDLSRSGLRLRVGGRPSAKLGETIELDIEAGGAGIRLPATVVRVQRVGFASTDLGVEFPELSEDQQRGLAFLARLATATPVTRPG